MITQKNITIDNYNYNLPTEKIAYFPVENRDESKLLVHKNGIITDTQFKNITDFLDSNHLLIFNNSRVIHARLLVHNKTGAAIEIFCLEPLSPTNEISQAFSQTEIVTWKCLVGNAKRWKEPLDFSVDIDGSPLVITAEKGESGGGFFTVTFAWDDANVTFAQWLEEFGKIPLPPYIKRAALEDDAQRYQTIYAKHNGSVAAPTAGLHFTDHIFQSMKEKNIDYELITLHVGAGTFIPVKSEIIGDHEMHSEQIIISASQIERLIQTLDKQIVAVGTTVVRTLESLFIIGAKLKFQKFNPFVVEQWEVYENEEYKSISTKESLSLILDYLHKHNLEMVTGATSLMIVPGYKHKLVKGLITNFHQPKSTLLLLVSSFLGDEWKNIYNHALTHDYRFLSYGDGNLYL